MKTARVAAVEFGRQMQSSENSDHDDMNMETDEEAAPPSSMVVSHTNGSSGGGGMRRRRSLSLAEPQPSVETVIVKAKRAAQSLWMLLHAQSCVLAQKCPHTGCQEAKLLHLHLKTCNAGANGECPMLYHGCDQSRKLLAHYRRCRSLRARQHANGSSNGNGGSIAGSNRPRAANGVVANPGNNNSTAHHCLVCSLMARQARTVLERTKSSSSSSYANPSATIGVASTTASVSSIKPNHYKKSSSTSASNARKVSYVLSAVEAESLSASSSSTSPTSRRGKVVGNCMPPPPPRSRSNSNADTSSLDSLARLCATAKNLEQENDDDDVIIPAPVVVRRERAASDAEVLLQGHKLLSGKVSNALSTLQHRSGSSSSTTTDGYYGGEHGDLDNSSGSYLNNGTRRERSASCGTAPIVPPRRAKSSSPPMSCDTILEE